ncbi:MAG: ice-binding family protein [Archangium sp.]|nr:ice-binding family protein [Archangium sp.]
MNPSPANRLLPRLSLLTALVFAACDPTPVPTPTPTPPTPELPGPLATLDIRASAATVTVGGAVLFTVVGHDAKGDAVEVSPAWSASGGGAIDAAGRFTAGTVAGSFPEAITVTSGSISARATVTITPGALMAIHVTPASATLAVNTRAQFLSTGQDAFGNPIAMAPAWSVAAGGGTITSDGIFTAGSTSGVFTATVRATQAGIFGKATVSIVGGQVATMAITPRAAYLAPGGTFQFTVTGADADGNALSVLPSWSTSAGGTISSTGRFTAGTVAGVFPNAVRANLGNVTAYASVTINAGGLARLTLTPTTATLPVNGVQQFFALGRDAAGNPIGVTPTWSVVSGGGTISADGLFTAGRSAGVFIDTIKVSSGLLADYVTVTITSDSLAVITVTPITVTLSPGTTQLFSAFGRDVNGNAVSISPAWAATAGGTIDAAGLFTAGTLSGTFINAVNASVGGVAGRASVTVSPGPLATIVITSPASTMAMSSDLQFTATGRDVNGNVVSLTPVWSIVAGGGAITPLGLFTSGTLAGTFVDTVVATSGSISSNATVTVTPGLLATLAITPAASTLDMGAIQQMTATGLDAFANPVVVTPTWAVLSGGGAIDTFGSFTAGTVAGSFPDTIRASSGAVSALASITVNAGPLATIVITGQAASLEVNTTRQLFASGRDASGNVVPLAATWSVVAGGGTIDAAGLFTAGTVAGTFTSTVVATSGTISGFATLTLTAAPPPPVVIALGAASGFAVLAGTSIINSGASALTGDVGLDPGVATAVTGFPPGNIIGVLHVNDALAVQAQTDLTSAYLAAQGKVCPTGNDKSGIDLGATPFAPGVYCFSSTAGLTGTLVLDGGGDQNAAFVFQVGSSMTTSTGSTYVLQNGAKAANVFWVVGSSATLGVNSTFPGTILSLTDVTLNSGATLLGRGLARNGTVTLDNNPVTVPAP